MEKKISSPAGSLSSREVLSTPGKAKRKAKSVAVAPLLSTSRTDGRLRSLSQSDWGHFLDSYELTKDVQRDLTFLFGLINVTTRIDCKNRALNAGKSVSPKNELTASETDANGVDDSLTLEGHGFLSRSKVDVHIDINVDFVSSIHDNSSGKNEKPKRTDDIENGIKYTDVRDISIRNCCITLSLAKVLSKTILELGNLISLTLSNAGLDDKSLLCIGQCLSSSTSLERLCLDGNDSVTDQKFHIFLHQPSSLKLKHLSLRHCGINHVGACNLSEVLSNNRDLLTLNLCFNKLGDCGAKWLAGCLRVNRTLLSLDLGSNGISDKGVKYFADVIKSFPLTDEETIMRRQLQIRYKYDRITSDRTNSNEEKRDTSKPKAKEKRVIKNKESHNKKAISDGKSNEILKPSREQSNDSFDHPYALNNLLLGDTVSLDGQRWVRGNFCLMNLNFSRNRITNIGLESLLTAVRYQKEELKRGIGLGVGLGLLKASLGKNIFEKNNVAFTELDQLLAERNPISNQ